MIKEELINCTVEALILASPEPVSLRKLSETMGNVSPSRIKQAVADLNNVYMGCGSSFRIREVAGGFQVHILPDFADIVKKMLTKERTIRLTRAALETLAIVAYKQPVTKIDIEHIRGVSSDGVLHNLLERKLIAIAGRAETPGRPLLYKTTNEFLKFFGLNRLSDLPHLEEIEEMIREAQPDKDQTEFTFNLSDEPKQVIEIEESEAEAEDGIDEETDGDIIARAHMDADATDRDHEQADAPDANENEPDDILGADFEPELMAERDAQIEREVSADGGNGNGSESETDDLDEDSATAVDLIFGDDSALKKVNRLSAMIYLPAGDDSTADGVNESNDESPEESSEKAEAEDGRVSDE